MKIYKSFKILLMLVLILMLINGCGPKNAGMSGVKEENDKPKIAYYAYSTEPFIDLDPSVEYSNGIVTLHNIYETLTKYNHKTQKVEPLLAESWESSEDGTHWNFKLRQGIKFHDGAILNAEAVKKSLDRTIAMKMGAAYIWDSVKEIKATDEYTVEFELDYAAPIDLIASAAYASFIMSPNVAEKDSTWFNEGNEAGTGPYTLQKATKGEEVVLAKFDEYWRGWKENQYDRVIIKKISESTSRRQLVEKGDAQITTSLSTTDINALKNHSNLVVTEAASWKNVMGFLNTRKKPLDNADFRKALSYAFPYEEIVTNVKENQASQSYGLIPEGLWGHDASLPQYHFDLDKAKELLEKSGVKAEGLKLEMTLTAGAEAHRNAAQLYQVNLKKLGIDLEIREMNWDSVWEKSKSKSPNDRQDILVMYWWPDFPSPISWLWSLVHSEENILFNLSYINNPKLDEMIEQGDQLSAVDREKSEELFKQVQKEVIEQAYQIFMYDDKTIWVTNKNFKGFESNPSYEGVVFFYDTYYEE
ncbi:ABC transporter substrate-binding protein [Geosporobacter ferrireducens]|uniref:ABC transporter substrate-binding protein n=1 Tax=Geosporobacter ferrireducens TaxID=1424294 RepID=A0A1D8GKH6_9FIRM|nr:ABC transporter substrate-binding protein [Geosporobacter ferrireducens]AOT71372.1 ABC transporter substrate-binding protein [Geosporobacter ferrireducens]MTI58364.1 ABC transporter substrate-binding protein [Geosporobacter ferrireducens]